MTDRLSLNNIELGQELPPQTKEITQENITRNAEASLDYNPIHIDPAWAKKVNLLGKGTTIAHGMMTLSFMGKVVTDWAYPGGGTIRSLKGKFVAPVRPGDRLTAKARISEIHPRKNEDSFVVIEVSVENQANVQVSVGEVAIAIPN
jgi:3-hydroxybutyryl-CoA dehydratase